MIRETSRIAWADLQASGLLKGMRIRVARYLFENGPQTAGEVEAGMKRESEVAPSYHKRLSELERMQVVERIGTRKCSITGRECEVWAISGRMPIKLDDRRDSLSPTRTEMRVAIINLRKFFKEHEDAFTPELYKLCTWLAKKYEA